jgi:23S rRNA pseudouridine2604 synthase
VNFRFKLKYFIVKKLKIANKTAQKLIEQGQILINNQPVSTNCLIHDTDTITWQNQLLQEGKTYKYYKLNKPKGIECTLNPDITNNLIAFLPEPNLFVVGRLDKDSCGLVLLTNNGKIFDKTLRQNHAIPKEYLVTLNTSYNTDFVLKMTTGVSILGKTTLPCQLWPINETSFKIILIEGKNRQIRRMCYKLGYNVVELMRLRIGSLQLGNLKVGASEACVSPLE